MYEQGDRLSTSRLFEYDLNILELIPRHNKIKTSTHPLRVSGQVGVGFSINTPRYTYVVIGFSRITKTNCNHEATKCQEDWAKHLNMIFNVISLD